MWLEQRNQELLAHRPNWGALQERNDRRMEWLLHSRSGGEWVGAGFCWQSIPIALHSCSIVRSTSYAMSLITQQPESPHSELEAAFSTSPHSPILATNLLFRLSNNSPSTSTWLGNLHPTPSPTSPGSGSHPCAPSSPATSNIPSAAFSFPAS